MLYVFVPPCSHTDPRVNCMYTNEYYSLRSGIWSGTYFWHFHSTSRLLCIGGWQKRPYIRPFGLILCHWEGRHYSIGLCLYIASGLCWVSKVQKVPKKIRQGWALIIVRTVCLYVNPQYPFMQARDSKILRSTFFASEVLMFLAWRDPEGQSKVTAHTTQSQYIWMEFGFQLQSSNRQLLKLNQHESPSSGVNRSLRLLLRQRTECEYP